jgi:lipopolysaccharide export system protein LptA
MRHWRYLPLKAILSRTMVCGLVVIGAVLILLPELTRGEETDELDKQLLRLRNPVEIQSQRLELRRQENMVVYSGEVVASQDEYKLKCETLEIHWNPEEKKIKYLIARGQVALETDEGVVTSGVGILDLTSRLIVLTESPRLLRGDESVEGEEIIYSISERKSTVKGGKEMRVKSRIIPGGKN